MPEDARLASPKRKPLLRPASRRDLFEAAGRDIPMPPLSAGQHLLQALWEVGPGTSNGMGYAPISFAEIEAWRWQTGVQLDAWEVRTLRSMSVAYVTESQEATRRERPAPWLPERVDAPGTPNTHRRRDRHIRSVIRG